MTDGREAPRKTPPTPLRRWAAVALGAILYGESFNLALSSLPPLRGLSALLAVAGLAGLFWTLRGGAVRRGALLGAAAYALAAAVGLFWMNAVSVPGYLGLVICFAAFGALLGAGAALLRRGAGPWTFPWLAAALWTALELARARLFTGFPWMLAGSACANVSPLMGLADLGGVYACSFFVAALAALLRPERPARRWLRPLAPALLVAAALCYGLLRAPAEGPAARRLAVVAVQARVPFKVGPKADPVAQLREQKRLTGLLAPGEADLVIWSETMVPGDLIERVEPLLVPIAREKRCWLLAGGVIHGVDEAGERTGRNTNSAVLVSPAGKPVGGYDKRHLVPFGEYVPLGGRFPGARVIFDLIGTVFSPGGSDQVLPEVAGLPLGVSICFEDAFPHLARRDAARGARLLVNLTNDSWFGRSAEAGQHLALAAFRAVETRRPLVRATNTGISALVGADGRIIVPENGGLWEKGLVRMDLRIGEPRRTVYMIVGDLFAWLCAAAAAAGVVLGVVRVRREGAAAAE